MAILVTCPGCLARFQVQDKFAGKQGPCPKCKTVITIPAGQVEIHAPEDYGHAKDAAGRPVLKPIERTDRQTTPLRVALVSGAILAVLVVCWLLGAAFQESGSLRAMGLLLVTPFILIGAYHLLRDDEMDAFQGRTLFLRAGICAVSFVALWVAFSFLPPEYLEHPWQWAVLILPFIAVGSLVGFASFDLEFGNGFILYAFYIVVSLLLRWVVGMDAIWHVVVPPAAAG